MPYLWYVASSMRLFLGKLPNVSKRRSSMALLVGTAVAIVLLSLGKEWHPPAYPVNPLPELTPESRKDLLWAAYGTRIPATISSKDVAHIISFEERDSWLTTLNLNASQEALLTQRYAHPELDPLLPALQQLHQRTHVLGLRSGTYRDTVLHYLKSYPNPMDGPDCTHASNSDFDQFVCLTYQATVRNAARMAFFTLWFEQESDRHQFGRIFEWARARTHQPRRTALLLHDSTKPILFQTAEEAKRTLTPGRPESVAVHAVSSFINSSSIVEATQTQLRPHAPFLEDWMYPHLTMSCGVTASTAHIRVAPLIDEDTDVHQMCLHEIQRRQQSESELQEIYLEILRLRDTALHNKNLLQFFAWVHQRKTLQRLKTLFAKVVMLEWDSLPAHSLWALPPSTSLDWTDAIGTLTAHLETGQAETLLAFVSQPPPHHSTPRLSAQKTPTVSSGRSKWSLFQGDNPAGVIHGKGNVYYLDARAKQTLGYNTMPDISSRLWTRCVDAAEQGDPITWCTAHQWMSLSYNTNQPGRLHQILHYSTDSSTPTHMDETPVGWMVLWGSALQQQANEHSWVAGTGSAGVTLFEHLNDQSIDPTDSPWPYASIRLELK